MVDAYAETRDAFPTLVYCWAIVVDCVPNIKTTLYQRLMFVG